MPFDLRINTKFHLFGIDHHELQFGRVLLIQQRGDNRIQADRFTLSGRTSHQQVGSLAQVEHKHLVDNRLSDRHRQVIRTFLEFARSDHRLHGNSLRFIIRDLDPDRSLTRHRRDNTYLQGGKAQSNIIFQVFNLRNTHTGFRDNLIERDRRSNRRLDRGDIDTEIFQRLLDHLLVFFQFFTVHLDITRIVELQQIECREYIAGQV